MTLELTTEGKRATSWEVIRTLILLAVAILLLAVPTAIFGMQHSGPIYDIVPDPAHLSGLPF